MSYDLTPGHGDESPYWIRDWNIREHDNTDETRTGQRFTADRRGWCVDTVRVLRWQESGILGVGNTPVGVPEIVARSINGPVFVVGARADWWLASSALWSCGYFTEIVGSGTGSKTGRGG